MPALASRALGHGISLSFGANAAERDCVSGGGEGAVFEVFIDESRPQSHERGNSLAAVNAKTTWLTPVRIVWRACLLAAGQDWAARALRCVGALCSQNAVIIFIVVIVVIKLDAITGGARRRSPPQCHNRNTAAHATAIAPTLLLNHPARAANKFVKCTRARNQHAPLTHPTAVDYPTRENLQTSSPGAHAAISARCHMPAHAPW